jgi:hypothetical protein
MANPTPERCPALKDRFAWYEKLLVRVALAALVGVALTGIYVESRVAALAYAVFAAVGGLLVVYDFLCVYCPYPYEYADCLFFPRQLLTLVVKRRSGRISRIRKALLLLVAAGLAIVPQYWLWRNWEFLAAFWILALLVGLSFGLHYCPRCRHGECVLNRAPGKGFREGA